MAFVSMSVAPTNHREKREGNLTAHQKSTFDVRASHWGGGGPTMAEYTNQRAHYGPKVTRGGLLPGHEKGTTAGAKGNAVY